MIVGCVNCRDCAQNLLAEQCTYCLGCSLIQHVRPDSIQMLYRHWGLSTAGPGPTLWVTRFTSLTRLWLTEKTGKSCKARLWIKGATSESVFHCGWEIRLNILMINVWKAEGDGCDCWSLGLNGWMGIKALPHYSFLSADFWETRQHHVYHNQKYITSLMYTHKMLLLTCLLLLSLIHTLR